MQSDERKRRKPPEQPVAMCGMMPGSAGMCRFSELAPGQFGLTKQLVFRLALPHISLLVVSCLYAVAGSWVLTAIRLNEDRGWGVAEMQRARSQLAHALTRKHHNHTLALDAFFRQAYLAHEADPAAHLGPPAAPAVFNPIANFTRNLFFTTTTLTSIGYGNDAPESTAGRLFCLFFLFFGIPLYLITLADLAKFCTEFMNRSYTEILKYKFTVVNRWKRWRKGKRSSEDDEVTEVIIAGGDDEVAEFLWTHLENTQFVEIPFIVIYVLLIGYIAAASWAIARIEGWSMADGFYFVMMSVLTVGFGDLVPRHSSLILVELALILVGLVLTTTCIDVVGAYYIDRLHFFGRRLDDEDPLRWLKAVQQARILAMKREAMRRLFETVTALHHIRLTAFQQLAQSAKEREQAPPEAPRNLCASHATADSMLLHWHAPLFTEEGKRYWYTLTYKPRTPERRANVTVIDFINDEFYHVTGLRSFTLYEFSIVTTTRYGASKPCKTQEYTEPCTVPQSLSMIAVSSETATLQWRPPKKNNAPESYVIQFAQEPAPQFLYWDRFRCGSRTRFTLTGLMPDTRYLLCVTAEHNHGQAAMSRSVRFSTRGWWGEDESGNLAVLQSLHAHRHSIVSLMSTLSGLR